MSSVNRPILIGRAGGDAELRCTPERVAVANFRLATNRIGSDRGGSRVESVDWHTVMVEAA